jgi:hypothetical protein
MQIFKRLFLLYGCLSLSFSLLGTSEQHYLNFRNPPAWTFKETALAATILSLGVYSLYEASVTLIYGDYTKYPPILSTNLYIKGAFLVPTAVFIGVFSWRKYCHRRIKKQNENSRNVFLAVLEN